MRGRPRKHALCISTVALFLFTSLCCRRADPDTREPVAADADSLFVTILIIGELQVDLTDPRGRVDSSRVAGTSDSIPGCERFQAMEEGDVAMGTRLELTGPTPGLYRVQLRKSGDGIATIFVTMNLHGGRGCDKGDTVQLTDGARYDWTVRWDRPPKSGGECPIEITGLKADSVGSKAHSRRGRKAHTP